MVKNVNFTNMQNKFAGLKSGQNMNLIYVIPILVEFVLYRYNCGYDIKICSHMHPALFFTM